MITRTDALLQWRKDAAMMDLVQELSTGRLRDAHAPEPHHAHDGHEATQRALPTAHDSLLASDLSGILDGCANLLEMFYWAGAIPVRLETFVGFLQDHKILPARPEYSFDQQERLQKCAFIAQEMFRLNLGYRHYLHAYGTFSTILAIDFSRIVKKRTPTSGIYIPRAFQAKKFVSLVSGRSIDWLAVASALVHEERYPHTRGSRMSRMLRVTAAYNKILVYRVSRALAKGGPTIPRPGPAGGDGA